MFPLHLDVSAIFGSLHFEMGPRDLAALNMFESGLETEKKTHKDHASFGSLNGPGD